MRLARTATPLPRNLPGWSRTSGLRFPKPAGWPCSPTGRCRAVPPAGVEPAPSRLRAGRHDRSTTGARRSEALESNQALLDISEPCLHGHRPPMASSSGGRIRTCASRLTVVRLAARPHRNGRRGSRTPKARRPTRFRDGTPHPWQSFQSGPGRIRTCTAPIKSRQLWPVELRSREMWPAGLEPAARRVSDGRSTR